MKFNPYLLIFLYFFFVFADCSKKTITTNPPPSPTPTQNDVSVYVTKADASALLQKQNDILSFANITNSFGTIEVDSTQSFQTIDGFGYTLTGGSAYLINRMSGSARQDLLNDLFSQNGMGISYLRLSMGASDLSTSVYSYNDLPAGQTDIPLANFSLSLDTVDVIPVLKEILSINPSIKLMASPWSAPVWMKTNGSSIGGSLQTQYYQVYANYFVKYIQAMKAKGIHIDAVTIQNEPEHGGNNPSMLMTATEQTNFIKNNLGPAFQSANLLTKIIIWDHNCDRPNYPITVLNDPQAKQYIDGTAFHLYAGDISALSTVKNAHPEKNIYFTEQWTGANGTFSGDLVWHTKNVIIGSMNNWSKVALEWNLASDATYNPHTPGGCTECKGALTIAGNNVTKNVSYYIIAHAAKFIPAGSVRIASAGASGLPRVAFKTPTGKKVLLIVNDSGTAQGFNIGYKGKKVFTQLNAGSVGTYVW